MQSPKISASPYLNDNIVDEDDTDDGKDSDSAKEVDPEPNNALSKSVARTLRISPRSETAGSGKGNGSKENNSRSTRLNKDELLLTKDNLAKASSYGTRVNLKNYAPGSTFQKNVKTPSVMGPKYTSKIVKVNGVYFSCQSKTRLL